MDHFTLFPLLVGIIYLAIVIGFIYLVFQWANKILALKQEQNDLMRELIKKIDNKQI